MARLKKLKAKTPPQKVILEYLEKNVSESLAERINSGDKTLQCCWNYIVKQAKQEAQNGCACCADNEVFGWAVHYFEEDQITEANEGQSAPRLSVTATTTDKKKPKKKEAEKPKTSGKEKAKKAETVLDQLSMFD